MSAQTRSAFVAREIVQRFRGSRFSNGNSIMITRVATFPLSDQMIAGALRTEATMSNLQVQENSGVQSQFLAGFGANTEQVVNLQVSVTRSQSYIDGATFADSKIQVMYNQMTTVTDTLSSLRSQLSAASTGTGTGT